MDEQGAFEGDVIVGSTFPNRNGIRLQRPELTLTVRGDRLTEDLASPGAPRLVIGFERVPWDRVVPAGPTLIRCHPPTRSER